jgi:hypothetical protein
MEIFVELDAGVWLEGEPVAKTGRKVKSAVCPTSATIPRSLLPGIEI